MKTEKIYIVLSYTGTTLSKIIKMYTKSKYCHVSISLDDKLDEMYSFGRLNSYIPFIGGFVHESQHYGTFYRFKKTDAEIYAIPVSKKQYQQIRKNIQKFKENRKKYKFNILGLFANSINYYYHKENSFYCAEFVKYILNESNLEVELPNPIKPIDFRNLTSSTLIYSGKLLEYNN